MGQELGEVVVSKRAVPEESFNSTLKKVIRIATKKT